MSMFNTESFFDRNEVLNKVDAAKKKVLVKFGAYTRKTARASIRKRKKPSLPGKPPSSHVGTLKQGIQFIYDCAHDSVIIGPARFPAAEGHAPSTLEYGGAVSNVKNRRRTVRCIGDTGVIRLASRRDKNAKKVKDLHGKTQYVIFARIKTTKQISRRVNWCEGLLWGDFFNSGIVEPRPYMRPAFIKELPKAGSGFYNSVR